VEGDTAAAFRAYIAPASARVFCGMIRLQASVTLLVLLLAPLPGAAATISVMQDGASAIVTLDGQLEPGDFETFQSKTNAISKAIVVLRSPGGSVLAGVRIGEVIRRKGFQTVVLDRCASACAIAWLGGKPRSWAPGAGVGFHAARDRNSGQESGAANALMGAYLNGIGLSYDAVVYMTQTPPDKIRWLTPADARRYNIAVTVVDRSVAVLHRDEELPSAPTREITIIQGSRTSTVRTLQQAPLDQVANTRKNLEIIDANSNAVSGNDSSRGFPNYSLDAQCQRIAKFASSAWQSNYDDCLARERTAADQVRERWSGLANSQREYCLRVASAGGGSSYVALKGCIDQN